MESHGEAGGCGAFGLGPNGLGQGLGGGHDTSAGQDSGASQDDYDLGIFARGVVRDRESEDDGIGHRPDKHAVPMLRLFTRAQGRPWLCWGGVTGGEEDADGRWFELYYHGMVREGGGVKFGHFIIRVEGDGLEPLRHQMAKHLRPDLRIGRTANHDHPIVVSDITIRRLKFDDVE